MTDNFESYLKYEWDNMSDTSLSTLIILDLQVLPQDGEELVLH